MNIHKICKRKIYNTKKNIVLWENVELSMKSFICKEQPVRFLYILILKKKKKKTGGVLSLVPQTFKMWTKTTVFFYTQNSPHHSLLPSKWSSLKILQLYETTSWPQLRWGLMYWWTLGGPHLSPKTQWNLDHWPEQDVLLSSSDTWHKRVFLILSSIKINLLKA